LLPAARPRELLNIPPERDTAPLSGHFGRPRIIRGRQMQSFRGGTVSLWRRTLRHAHGRRPVAIAGRIFPFAIKALIPKADCFGRGFAHSPRSMTRGSLRLILSGWKRATSLQHVAHAVLLLALFLLSGCSELALTNEEMPTAGADPSYSNVVAYYLKNVFKDQQAYYDAFEISAFRWVHSVKGWGWLTCVRFQDRGHQRIYAVLMRDGKVLDGHYAVQTDACDAQTYVMFEAMRAGRPGIQSPLY
jgi:hypothetical protein